MYINNNITGATIPAELDTLEASLFCPSYNAVIDGYFATIIGIILVLMSSKISVTLA
jgi:hypothetical protein